MGAATTPAPAVGNVARPARPSLRSTRTISYRKNGDLITLELSNSSKAAESLRELAKKNPTTEQDRKFIADIENAEAGGLVATVYDALSFWVMEFVEIGLFGPYDEVRPA